MMNGGYPMPPPGMNHLASLNHPNIASIHGLEEAAGAPHPEGSRSNHAVAPARTSSHARFHAGTGACRRNRGSWGRLTGGERSTRVFPRALTSDGAYEIRNPAASVCAPVLLRIGRG